MIALAHKMGVFTMPYVVTAQEAKDMAEAGADVIIAHVGCTIGWSIGVTDAVGFVGASSLERMAVENPLTELTQQFKSIPVKRKF